MMASIKYLLVGMSIGVLIYGCKKEELPEPIPPISATPSISVKNINTSVKQFDDIQITLGYLDGDGDIGFENADSAVVYITDNRFPVTEGYHVPPLAPLGANISIQGDLILTIENVILDNQSNSTESATFSIKLRDRAGNWSNEVTSRAVTITQ